MRPIVGRAAGLTPVDFGPASDHALLGAQFDDAQPIPIAAHISGSVSVLPDLPRHSV